MFTRRQQSQQTRNNAAQLAANRPLPPQVSNSEESQYRRTVETPNGEKESLPSYIANFTKGLPHDKTTGLLQAPRDYEAFVRAIDSGDVQDFAALRLGPGPFTDTDEYQNFDNGEPVHDWSNAANRQDEATGRAATKVRAWESQGAGLTFDLEGPDAQALTMPPAPRLDSQELIAEMAEVYWMSILRDVAFSNYSPGRNPEALVTSAQSSLARFYWFANESTSRLTLEDKSPEAIARRRILAERRSDEVPLNKLFRGVAKGDDVGPYISQFLLIGNTGINGQDNARPITKGMISYGAVTIDQRVRFARSHEDFMTTWEAWLDVQDGADVRGRENYVPEPQTRFITTPRDLATYVHYDALYEAYLNACLILLSMGAPFDPGIPFRGADFRDKQQGFAQFGGPHILSLVTEVATRALKAVRFQKFNVHRRLRPEAIGGLLYQWDKSKLAEVQVVETMLDAFNGSSGLTPRIRAQSNDGLLLPMAFPEGSPMHPSYGAGHATVAGACVTILKAFFDTGWELPLGEEDGKPVAYHANHNGSALDSVKLDQALTVEGELNKLAANISIGRNWAGVHYYSDYIESLRLGEQVAIGILEEQKLTYGENFSMTIPLFDGGAIRI
ncbi:MAG: vanadium-dependent haloperoxidase [Cyanobacteria bacterium P01_F01_bin.42]